MKKLFSFITCIAMCMMLVMPVSAAEIAPEEEIVTMTQEAGASVYTYNNYFRKITPKLNGEFTVSTGSDPFYVYVEDPKGNVGVAAVSSSGTITTDAFNGLNPAGDWYVWIVTAGDVSTATITLTVNYSY